MSAETAPSTAVLQTTPRQLAATQIAALCRAIGQPQLGPEAFAAIDILMASWADVPFGGLPPSTLTIDGSTFELSLAMPPNLAVRGLVAPPAADADEMWTCGLEVHRRIVDRYGIDLRWFEAIGAVFAPQGTAARWSLWHGFEVTPAGVGFKCYLNPNIGGPEAAEEIVCAGMRRLHLPAAAEFVHAMIASNPALELAYVCLDLAGPAARAKVYFEPAGAGADVNALERLLSHDPNYRPGLAQQVADAVDPARERYSRQRPVCSVAFRSDRPDAPEAVTLQWPVWPHATHDEVALARCASLFGAEGGALLSRAVAATSRRPLAHGVGLIQWISARRTPAGDRYVAYLAAEAFGGIPPRF